MLEAMRPMAPSLWGFCTLEQVLWVDALLTMP